MFQFMQPILRTVSRQAPLRFLVTIIAVLLMGAGTLPAYCAEGELAPINIIRAPGVVTVDGHLDDWVQTAPVSYEVDSTAFDQRVHTYAMWDDKNLYLAYVVRDTSPMKNGGNDPAGAMKSGDTLHCYFSTDPKPVTTRSNGGPHDFHVLMTVQEGKPVIFAFRQEKAGVTTKSTISAAGGATNIDIAWMGAVPGAELAITTGADKQGQSSYTAEVKLPLAFFDNYHPIAGTQTAMDVAVNFSNTTGARNMAKVWWHRGASMINDLPTELRFDRDRWGIGQFRAPGEQPIIIDRSNLFIVPAPGKVAIDGDLGDWDMTCAYGPVSVDPQLKEKNNVTWVMMYDQEALYMGAIFKSAFPLENVGGVDNRWWYGDSLEYRLATNTKMQDKPMENDDLLSFGVWYNSVERKDYIAICRSFNFRIDDNSTFQVKSKAIAGGRSFEARVPWSVVKSGNIPKAGDDVACTLTAIYKSGLRAFGMGSINSFRGMNDWGRANFLAKGQQPVVYRQIEADATAEVATAKPVKSRVTVQVPAAGLFSAGVYNDAGRLVRTLFAGKDTVAGPQEIGWDGEVDGGQAATPGKYQVRALVNSGLQAQYVMSPASEGNPPHPSPNALSGWGGGMAPVVDIAADSVALYPVWGFEEAVGSLIRIDEAGIMRWRQRMPLATSGINSAVATNGKYVYVAVDISTRSKNDPRTGIWRVRCEDGVYVPFPHEESDPLAFYLDGIVLPDNEMRQPNHLSPVLGMAADSKVLYAASYYQNKVVAYDAETGKRLRDYDVAQPKGICLDGKGYLLVVSGGDILRLDAKSGKTSKIVATGLAEPWHVAVDKAGKILVTDRGSSQQIKRFDRKGKLLDLYGKAGGRENNGKYESDKLLKPAGITVSPAGKIYFTEHCEPRIMMRLSDKMQYEHLWVGPWYSSGSVTVDPNKPTDFYLMGLTDGAMLRHTIDYATKTSRPDAVWEYSNFPVKDVAACLSRVINYQGQTYIFSSFQSPPNLIRIDGDKALLVMAFGMDRGQVTRPWVFTDRNENGKMDEGEKVFLPIIDGKPISIRYMQSNIDERNMTLYLNTYQDRVVVVEPTFIRPGVPVYDFTKVRVIPLAAAKRTANCDIQSIWPTSDGGVFGNADAPGSDPRGIDHSSHLSDVYAFRLDKDGNLLWRAGKKASGLAKNGEFYGRATGLGGPLTEQYFDFVDETGGQDKIYTNDGLFVGNLLEDCANGVRNEYTLPCEHFGSCVYQNQVDNKWYLTAGCDGFANIWEIVGLDKIARMSADLTLE